MPDYEPNVDAPAYYWAGEYDAQQIADATGASWAAPIFALNQPRVIDVAALCAAPPPSAPTFTTTDLVLSLNPFADNTALREKLQNYTDAGLHRTFCTAVDVPPLPPMPSNPPPADLPQTDVPVSTDMSLHRQMLAWLQFVVKQMLPRYYRESDPGTVSGTGHVSIDADGESEHWSVYACGVRFEVIDKPDYLGRSNGGDFPVYYDMGWVSVDAEGYAAAPIRLAHTSQIVGPVQARVDGFYYNLPPGVEVRWMALYPDTPSGSGGG